MSGVGRSTRAVTAVVVAAAAVLLAAAPAPARKDKGKKTKIVSPAVVDVDRATDISPEKFMVWGDLDAGHRRCIANRKVVVRVNYENALPAFVDLARTGSTGAWGAIGAIELVDGLDVESIVATAQKRKIRLSKRKRLVCKKDTGRLFLGAMM